MIFEVVTYCVGYLPTLNGQVADKRDFTYNDCLTVDIFIVLLQLGISLYKVCVVSYSVLAADLFT